MDVHVRVDIDEDGPVVVKSATGRAVGRLRHEHRRLARAVHPGVVALARHQPDPAPPDVAAVAPAVRRGHDADGDAVDDTDTFVLHTRYAGEPVARWTGTVTGVAGLGAAVAGTLADLHRLGVVHGRIDSSHILIGDDSRPRLCGLAHPGDATPADDVAALGAVLRDLLERAPVGRLRRPRGSAGAARALRQVIERATDPVPTRRPSAGALADAIVGAVPGADLPAPIGAAGSAGAGGSGDARRARGRGRRGGGGAGTAARAPEPVSSAPPDTLDRIWSYAGEQSDDERWAAAFGTGPRDLPVGGVPSRAPTGIPSSGEAPGFPLDGPPPPLPMAQIDTPAWSDASGGRISSETESRPHRTADARDHDLAGGATRFAPETPDGRDAASGLHLRPDADRDLDRDLDLDFGPDVDPVLDDRNIDHGGVAERDGGDADDARDHAGHVDRLTDARDHLPDTHRGERSAHDDRTGRLGRFRDTSARPWHGPDSRHDASDRYGDDDRNRDGDRRSGGGHPTDRVTDHHSSEDERRGDERRGDERRGGGTQRGDGWHENLHSRDGRGLDRHRVGGRGAHGGGADWADDPADDHLLTRDHHVPVARVARPGPGDEDDAPGSDRARRAVVVAALAIATCLALAGAFMVSTQGGDGSERAGTVESPGADALDCPPATAPVADVDGDGCAEGLVVDGSTVDAGVARWTLGEPGDLVTVGDWDCDGEASAALLRPTTGDVFVFAAWAPTDEPVTVSASQQVDGGIGIRAQPADGDGCDRLLVDRADGSAATVEVPR